MSKLHVDSINQDQIVKFEKCWCSSWKDKLGKCLLVSDILSTLCIFPIPSFPLTWRPIWKFGEVEFIRIVFDFCLHQYTPPWALPSEQADSAWRRHYRYQTNATVACSVQKFNSVIYGNMIYWWFVCRICPIMPLLHENLNRLPAPLCAWIHWVGGLERACVVSPSSSSLNGTVNWGRSVRRERGQDGAHRSCSSSTGAMTSRMVARCGRRKIARDEIRKWHPQSIKSVWICARNAAHRSKILDNGWCRFVWLCLNVVPFRTIWVGRCLIVWYFFFFVHKSWENLHRKVYWPNWRLSPVYDVINQYL